MPEETTQPAQPQGAAQIDHELMRTFLVPLASEIFSNMIGKGTDGEKRMPLLFKILENKALPVDFEEFDKDYFIEQTGYQRRFFAMTEEDKKFRTFFRKAFMENFERKRQLSGKYEALNLYCPDDKGAFGSENLRRIVALTYEVTQQIETEKIREKMGNGEVKGSTGTDLENGQLRLFIDPANPNKTVALSEQDAQKEQYAGLQPYIEFGLRDDAISDRSDTILGQPGPQIEPLVVSPPDRKKQLKKHFGDSRAAAAQSMMEKNGLRIAEPFKVDDDGKISGKVIAKDPNGAEHVLNVNVTNDPANLGQLQFDFSFESMANLSDSCPRNFRLLADELKNFKPEGKTAKVEDVAREAVHLRVKIVAGKGEKAEMPALGAGAPGYFRISGTGEEGMAKEGFGALAAGQVPRPVAAIPQPSARGEAVPGEVTGEVTAETVAARKQALERQRRTTGGGQPRPLSAAYEEGAEEGETPAGPGEKMLSPGAKALVGAGIGSGAALLVAGGGAAAFVAGQGATQQVSKPIGFIIHCIAKICLS